MTQLDQFRNKLGHLSYQDIMNLYQAERTAKEKDEMLATPIQYVQSSQTTWLHKCWIETDYTN